MIHYILMLIKLYNREGLAPQDKGQVAMELLGMAHGAEGGWLPLHDGKEHRAEEDELEYDEDEDALVVYELSDEVIEQTCQELQRTVTYICLT